MVKLRLKRMGTIDKPFYRIVAVDSRKKRDGAYLENIGYYDPKTDPLTLKIESDRALYWLGVGAQPSDTVRSLLRKAGVLQKWHTMKFTAKAEEETVPVAVEISETETAEIIPEEGAEYERVD
ncbi:MAG: 30S ribosomal protein S16 [Candidatus Cloacimonetes bacterium]|nr:30S ribosomal protein S16 [Candidatus Cloacimonadota bacterium]